MLEDPGAEGSRKLQECWLLTVGWNPLGLGTGWKGSDADWAYGCFQTIHFLSWNTVDQELDRRTKVQWGCVCGGACFFFYSRHICLGTPFQYFTEHEPRRHGMVIAITVARARPPHTGKHCVSAMCQAPYKPYHLLLFHLFSPMRYYSFLFACELTEAQSP